MIPCDNYRYRCHRRGYALGIYYPVPTCACGVDRADHDELALTTAPAAQPVSSGCSEQGGAQ